MPAYLVSQHRISPEYDAYKAAVIALNHKYGARVITRAGSAKCLEGDWQAQTLVIIEFASAEAAQRFYESAEYAEVKKLRSHAPPITLVMVDGA